jgi:hypothetical protein
MSSEWPSGLDQFGEFLRKQGMSFDRRGSVPYTGDKIWQYATSKLAVRVVAERGFLWGVEIADIAGWAQEGYPASELRELLTSDDSAWSSESDDKIDAERKFVEEHWLAIVEAFSPDKREETHNRLKLLRKQRNERLWR